MAARRLRTLAAALLAGAVLAAGAGAAAQASLREFVAYFDWNRAELTPDAAHLVGQFAYAHRQQPVSRVVVIGHADRSGAEAYNAGLSLRRAETVAAELARQGVDPAIITVEARGETQPQLRTLDGVAEQLNRRAEIVYLR
jgi:outer membrane protein OmpA-like peptidoglycan-associated protein